MQVRNNSYCYIQSRYGAQITFLGSNISTFYYEYTWQRMDKKARDAANCSLASGKMDLKSG
jgi:hypothetical protein